MKKGYLILEDGTQFQGTLIGDAGSSEGEVVFNTSMVGYDQIITDPSYAGQIVVMTYPLIGNYGVFADALESAHPSLNGLVIRDLGAGEGSCHYQQEDTLENYLIKNELPCLTGVDTRALTRLIRTRGTIGGVISDSNANLEELIERARQAVKSPQPGYVLQVSSKEPRQFGQGKRVVLMDFGTKKSIITSLVNRGCEVIVVPAEATAEQILQYKPQGLVLSNGPGDPMECPYAISTVAKLIGVLPIFGICLGHQLLALSLGATTYKLRFGHRGANHPVKNLDNGRIFITSQNHGYAVEADSLAGCGAEISYINMNDGTVEGLVHTELGLNSVQFHPEASPGPQDTRHLFDDFVRAIA